MMTEEQSPAGSRGRRRTEEVLRGSYRVWDVGYRVVASLSLRLVAFEGDPIQTPQGQ